MRRLIKVLKKNNRVKKPKRTDTGSGTTTKRRALAKSLVRNAVQVGDGDDENANTNVGTHACTSANTTATTDVVTTAVASVGVRVQDNPRVTAFPTIESIQPTSQPPPPPPPPSCPARPSPPQPRVPQAPIPEPTRRRLLYGLESPDIDIGVDYNNSNHNDLSGFSAKESTSIMLEDDDLYANSETEARVDRYLSGLGSAPQSRSRSRAAAVAMGEAIAVAPLINVCSANANADTSAYPMMVR